MIIKVLIFGVVGELLLGLIYFYVVTKGGK
nr:MAG TPA: hypothetical protein [Caudoviricetes sp.]